MIEPTCIFIQTKPQKHTKNTMCFYTGTDGPLYSNASVPHHLPSALWWHRFRRSAHETCGP